MKDTSPSILIPQIYTKQQVLRTMELRRKKNVPRGTWTTDLAELRKAIVLCGLCQGKFDWRHKGYFSVWRYEHQAVNGACDACGVQIYGGDGRLFLHEANRPQAWLTKDESRNHRQTMVRMANTR